MREAELGLAECQSTAGRLHSTAGPGGLALGCFGWRAVPISTPTPKREREREKKKVGNFRLEKRVSSELGEGESDQSIDSDRT